MLYVIIYDIKNTDRYINFISKLKEFGEIEFVVSSAIFLISNESCARLYNEAKEVLNVEDIFFITKVDPSEREGRLYEKTTDWVNEYEKEIYKRTRL